MTEEKEGRVFSARGRLSSPQAMHILRLRDEIEAGNVYWRSAADSIEFGASNAILSEGGPKRSGEETEECRYVYHMKIYKSCLHKQGGAGGSGFACRFTGIDPGEMTSADVPTGVRAFWELQQQVAEVTVAVTSVEMHQMTGKYANCAELQIELCQQHPLFTPLPNEVAQIIPFSLHLYVWLGPKDEGGE